MQQWCGEAAARQILAAWSNSMGLSMVKPRCEWDRGLALGVQPQWLDNYGIHVCFKYQRCRWVWLCSSDVDGIPPMSLQMTK